MRAWVSRHQGFVTVAAVLLVVAVAIGLAGCSDGWTRIETPGNFPNGVFACHGTDGIYQSSDAASSMIVVGHDDNCMKGAASATK